MYCEKKCYPLVVQQCYQALLAEITLTPKPGLVDKANTGSHHDMNFDTFIDSLNAITPYFAEFYMSGKQHASIPVRQFLSKIRPIGIDCEIAMFKATNDVNTHKGGIFAFGLLTSAVGRLEENNITVTTDTICTEIAQISAHLIEEELKNSTRQTTYGEKIYHLYKATGARGEAASGYATVREISLPIYMKMQQQGHSDEIIMMETLLHLMAYNEDTNLIARGGMQGLRDTQARAKTLIRHGGMLAANAIEQFIEFDNELIRKNLSPGGSADLLSITHFLANYSS